MLKWQGMLLSDHNERIRQDELMEAHYKRRRTPASDELALWDELLRWSKETGGALRITVSPDLETAFVLRGRVNRMINEELYIHGDGFYRLHKSEISAIEKA